MIEFFIRQKKFAFVLTLLMIVIGVLSFTQIQRDQFPNVDFEVMNVLTLYPNSSPLDVEQDVTNLIEDKLSGISGIDFYSSFSKEGLSRITIQLDPDSDDIDQVKQDIRTEISSISDFPEDVTPRVWEQKTSRGEILRVNLAGSVNMTELERIAKNLKDKIIELKGVSDVGEDGNVDTEIKIYVEPALLEQYRLSLADVINKMRSRNYRYTAGDNNNPADNNNIVVLEKFSTSGDIKDIILKANFNGGVVYLSDVATIETAPAELSDILRVNGKTGYELKVRKSSSADVINTVDAVKEIVTKFQANYSDSLEIFYTNDQSKQVRNRLSIVSQNALIGFFLVLVMLGIFLSLRTAFWVGLGMTAVLLGVATLLLLAGETINLISLAAIILVLGLVVDDSIIVAESIEGAKEKDTSVTGIAKGYKRVIRPVVTTILTSIIAMSSMFLMEGTMGKFIYIIPVVIIFALILSFIEVTFALPAHLNNGKSSKPRKWFAVIERGFVAVIYPLLTLRYLIILLFVAGALYSFYFAKEQMKFTLFPASGSDTITARLKTDTSFDLLRTAEVSLQVENAIISTVGENLEFISADIGGSSPNRSSIDIRLIPVSERSINAPEIVDQLKEATKNIPNVEKLDISTRRPGPPQGKDMEVVLTSNNDTERESASLAVKRILESIEGVSDIDLDNDEGKGRMQVEFDFERMARLGINFSEVQDILSASFSGVKVADTRRGNIDIDYKIFLGKDSTIDILDMLTITNNKGRVIPLDSFISIKRISGEPDYNHYNGKRSITVSASLDDKITNALEVTNQIKTELNADTNYPDILVQFEGGSAESKQSLMSFAIAFSFAIGVIYLVLIILFNSYSQPLIILSAVPFAFVGVIWSFYLHAEPLSFFTLLGSLALVGVVVNDSLVMVSHLNYIRDYDTKGEPTRKWVARGAKDRLRAVVLTSVTTLMGILPLIYSIGDISLFIPFTDLSFTLEGRVDIFLQPMALALGYGLLSATFITLILIPSFYLMNYEITRFFGKLFAKKSMKLNISTRFRRNKYLK